MHLKKVSDKKEIQWTDTMNIIDHVCIWQIIHISSSDN